MKTLTIATRKSALAMWQAEHIKQRLEVLYPDIQVMLLGIVSKGDKLLDAPLAKIGGKGLFVKELEAALLSQEADIAVHSIKDVPMDLPEGLELAAICERGDPLDAFVCHEYDDVLQLPKGAVVGTSSLRRQCQLLAVRPDLQIRFLRGNVQTRLAKLDRGEYAAIILAAAGLQRLGLAARIASRFSWRTLLPAVGQGALGIECRADDEAVKALLQPLQHHQTTVCVLAERAMNRQLNGGCQVPIGGFAQYQNETLSLHGLVGSPDATTVLRAHRQGRVQDAEALGRQVADDLLDQGAKTLLDQLLLMTE